MLDPNNGNVIAMASYPTYDPAEFVNGISRPYAEAEGNDPTKQPVHKPGDPGHVRARLDVQAGDRDRRARERTSSRPTRTSTTPAPTSVAAGRIGVGCPVRTPRAPDGSINVTKALTLSTDDVLLLARRQLLAGGPGEGHPGYARNYGFGSDTGVQLPFEPSGVVPDGARKKQQYPNDPDSAKVRT